MDSSLQLIKIKRNKKIKNIITYTVKYSIFLLLAILLLLPYVFMINKSLMDISQANSIVPSLFTKTFRVSNYEVFLEYWPNFKNSLIIVFINGFFIPVTGMMVAFPFARHKFSGKNVLFAIMMSTVMLPGCVTLIPTYLLFSRLNLVDKVASQWIGAFWGGGAINIFLMIQFMRSIPKDFDEAASLDGANQFQIFFTIMVPMCLNVMIYIAIGTIIGRWSDFQGPLIYLTTPSKFTVAVAFYFDFSSSGNSFLLSHKKMAMAACMTVLPALLFFIFQKQMIGGIKIGGIKG